MTKITSPLLLEPVSKISSVYLSGYTSGFFARFPRLAPHLANLATLLILIISCATVSPSFAQRSDLQSWTLVSTNINLDADKRWFLYAEAQPRIGDDISRMERLLIRPAVAYNLSDKLALYLGYAWTPTFTNASYDHDFRNENRIWQQLLYKHQLWGLQWQHRLRQEQRIIEDASATSNRTRYLVRGSYGLASDESYGLTGYNELFVTENGTEKGPIGGFDRDRFFFGPYLKIGSSRFELGYLGEYARQFGNDSRMINAILLSLQI